MTLRVETAGDAVVLTIDRPKAKNAIDRATAKSLGDAVRAAAATSSVRGIVIAGAGDDTFASGGDLKEIDALSREPGGAQAILSVLADVAACEEVDVPVIAAVQGNAFGGGCELILLCDLVILESHASLVFRHAKMGLTPAWGGATRLTERVGPLEAARLLFTAESVDAEEALRIRLVNEVVAPGQARDRAVATVSRIAENPRATVAALKRALRAAREAGRGDALMREQAIFAEMWGGPDHRAALAAFLTRR